MGDDAWVDLGGVESDEDYFAEFGRRFGLTIEAV
jgi:hypothetical protein